MGASPQSAPSEIIHECIYILGKILIYVVFRTFSCEGINKEAQMLSDRNFLFNSSRKKKKNSQENLSCSPPNALFSIFSLLNSRSFSLCLLAAALLALLYASPCHFSLLSHRYLLCLTLCLLLCFSHGQALDIYSYMLHSHNT